MTQDQILTLVRAHYAGDGERWKTTLLQIAAGMKSERYQADLQRMAYNQFQQLSRHASERLTSLPHRELSGLVLDSTVYSSVAEICLEHERRFDLVAAGLTPRKRLLLYGPPGNGKTSLAAALAVRLRMNGYALSLQSTVSSYMGTTGTALSEAWEVTRNEQHLLLLDELDALAGCRGGSSGVEREYNLIVATLLKLLDEPPCGFIVAATNRLDVVDPAIRRRFDLELELGATEAGLWQLARGLGARFNVTPNIDGAKSFDSVEKLMINAARKRVLANV